MSLTHSIYLSPQVCSILASSQRGERPGDEASSILYEYKDCKSVLKKDGWELSQYQKLLRESSEQFEFGGYGSLLNREGSRRKKGGKKQSSRKSKKKDRPDDSEPVGGVRIEEEVHVQQPPRTQVRVCDRVLLTHY